MEDYWQKDSLNLCVNLRFYTKVTAMDYGRQLIKELSKFIYKFIYKIYKSETVCKVVVTDCKKQLWDMGTL